MRSRKTPPIIKYKGEIKMVRFKINTMYKFSYNKYVTVMRQHGYTPDTNRKVFDGHCFTVQDNTDYIVLRIKHQWITVNLDMCEEVR